MLVRRDYRIRKDQDEFLKTLKGNSSEHIRLAIDDYIQKMQVLKMHQTAKSPSKTLYSFGHKEGSMANG